MELTRTEKDKIQKKIEIAIDKMVDLEDMAFENDRVQRILDLLNELEYRLLN